jgi:hypothetical protein
MAASIRLVFVKFLLVFCSSYLARPSTRYEQTQAEPKGSGVRLGRRGNLVFALLAPWLSGVAWARVMLAASHFIVPRCRSPLPTLSRPLLPWLLLAPNPLAPPPRLLLRLRRSLKSRRLGMMKVRPRFRSSLNQHSKVAVASTDTPQIEAKVKDLSIKAVDTPKAEAKAEAQVPSSV